MPLTRNIYGPLFRLITGLIILAVINWILTSIPMVKALSIPGLPITIAAIISVIVGIIMIVILLNFSRDVAPAMKHTWPAMPETGSIISSGVTLGLIIVAYLMFDDFFSQLLPITVAVYSRISSAGHFTNNPPRYIALSGERTSADMVTCKGRPG
jgi:hypothetical protein